MDDLKDLKKNASRQGSRKKAIGKCGEFGENDECAFSYRPCRCRRCGDLWCISLAGEFSNVENRWVFTKPKPWLIR